MPTPHKHAELIKKWADDPSLEIEWKLPGDTEWRSGQHLHTSKKHYSWDTTKEYRIKPKLVKREGWMLVRSSPNRALVGHVYPNSFVYTDECDIPATTGSFKNFIKIKVEWEEEV